MANIEKAAMEAAPTHSKGSECQTNMQIVSDILSAFSEKEPQQETNYSWNSVYDWEIDSTKEYPSPDPLIKCGKIGAFEIGNIHAISAKYKQGKSFLVTIFASVILGHSFGEIEPTKSDAKALVIDTEQDISDVAAMKRRINTLIGAGYRENTSRIKVVSIRDKDLAARMAFIADIIAGMRPTAAFLDNVADLAANFNDNVECNKLITKLGQIAGENRCALICVIHENPGGDSSKMKGHIGTLLGQKMASQFTIKKENGVFRVTQCDSRHGEMQPFSFALDEHLIPVSAADIVAQQEVDYREGIKNKFLECFGGMSVLSQADLVKKMLPIFEIKSDRTARNRIDDGIYYQILSVKDSGRKKYYSLTDGEK